MLSFGEGEVPQGQQQKQRTELLNSVRLQIIDIETFLQVKNSSESLHKTWRVCNLWSTDS